MLAAPDWTKVTRWLFIGAFWESDFLTVMMLRFALGVHQSNFFLFRSSPNT